MKSKIDVRRIVAIVSALVLVFVCVTLVGRWTARMQAVETQQAVQELYRPGAASADADAANAAAVSLYVEPAFAAATSASPAVASTKVAAAADKDGADDAKADEAEELVIQDDFKELYKANPDIIGWLTAGDFIDYPVVFFDNDFYLLHDFFGEYDSNGTLFVNAYNMLNPRDDVLLIHGHNMESGLMFGTLEKFMEFDYASRYPIVSFRTIYDKEDVYYTPIAVFNASMLPDDPEYFNIMQVKFEDDEPQADAEAAGAKDADKADADAKAASADAKADKAADTKTDKAEADKAAKADAKDAKADDADDADDAEKPARSSAAYQK